MSDDGALTIDGGPAIPLAELSYRASRSGGPGGQHVNTSSTRVELTWDVAHSSALDDEQRARLLDKLANRIDADGVLHLASQTTRSQHRNREIVTARLAELVARALRRPKRRKRTRPPARAKEARLREKKERSEKKRLRGPVDGD